MFLLGSNGFQTLILPLTLSLLPLCCFITHRAGWSVPLREDDTQGHREQPQQMTEKQTEAVLGKQNRSSFRMSCVIFAREGSHED